MRLDLVPEHQHAEVRVRRLVHGFGLDAHAVLLRGQLVRTVLLVPQVEQPGHRRPDHHEVTVQVLPVKVHILTAPAFHFQVKAPKSESPSDIGKSSQSQNPARKRSPSCVPIAAPQEVVYLGWHRQ